MTEEAEAIFGIAEGRSAAVDSYCCCRERCKISLVEEKRGKRRRKKR
jgi:hypothetical protein